MENLVHGGYVGKERKAGYPSFAFFAEVGFHEGKSL